MTTALVAGVTLFTFSSLPPARIALATSWRDGSVPGVLHIHSNRSDGRSRPEAIAAAAARAGLAFIVLTDHGDGTRMPDAPIYRSGVLCLDAVELSTTGGHYIALGLPDAPYPLGGAPADVVEDVRRLGGIGIVAHPDSPKDELRWHDWDAPIDGLESINPDTSWRQRVFDGPRRSRWLVFRSLIAYPFRAPETLARMLTSSPEMTEQWSRLIETRPVVAIAGADAHAKLELGNMAPGDNRYSLPLPGYESSFRLLSVHATPAEPFNGDAARDARLLLDAIRAGRAYTAIDGWAAPPAFEFSATNASGSTSQGGTLVPNGPLTVHVRSNAPAGFETRVWRGSSIVARSNGDQPVTLQEGSDPGVYRVEVLRPDAFDVPPWITSNPIYVRNAPPPVVPAPAPPVKSRLALFDGNTANGWSIESDATSLGAVEAVPVESGKALRLRFGLSGGMKQNQFAGTAVATTSEMGGYDQLAFSARSDLPMRLSVQVRVDVPGSAPERYESSVYLDDVDRPFTVALNRMRPVGATAAARPDPAAIRSVLFIVETTNTRPGASGRVWLRDVRAERTRP